MSVEVKRLTQIVEVVRLWSFFVEGFHFVGRYRKYGFDIPIYGRIIRSMVKMPSTAWVGVAFIDDSPVAFWCAHEITSPHTPTDREFEIFLRFHKPQHLDATYSIQAAFETWCRDQHVKRYFITTRRDEIVGPRRFPAPEYGLKKAYTVFKKEL